MITNEKFEYCELCGKKLKVNDLGIKTIGYNRRTGEKIQVHEYGLVCPDSSNPSHHIHNETYGVYIYREPV